MRDDNRNEIIHDAIGFLDDELIEDVDALRSGTTPPKQEKGTRPILLTRRWMAIAASICLIVVVSGIWNSTIGSNTMSNMESFDEKEPENVQEDVLQENAQEGEEIVDKFEEEEMEDCVIESIPMSSETEKEDVEETEDTQSEE